VLAATITILLAISSVRGSTIDAIEFDSDALGSEKRILIYVPDSYEETNTKFPVIYLLHGFGASEGTWVSDLNLQSKADQLALNALIVMPDGDRSAFLNSYEDYFVDEIVGIIDSSYRTVASPEGRALIGESAGGFAAMHIGLRYTDLFGSIASHSGWVAILFDPTTEKQLEEIFQRPGFSEWETLLGLSIESWRAVDPYTLVERFSANELSIYFDSGMEDEYGFHEVAQQFKVRLDELGLDYEYHAVPGGRHDDQYFSSRIQHSLRFHISYFRENRVYP